MSFVDPRGLKIYPDEFFGPLPGDGYRKSQMTKTRRGLVPPSDDQEQINNGANFCQCMGY